MKKLMLYIIMKKEDLHDNVKSKKSPQPENVDEIWTIARTIDSNETASVEEVL